MDKQAAVNIIRDTFESPFDKARFVDFIKNLLNRIDETKAFHIQGNYIPESFRDCVKAYERIGTYTDRENNKIDILVVYLQKETSLERARTAQRNFVARYLKERDEKEAGLVAFVSPGEEDWRFSLVKMDYLLEESPSGKTKVRTELTPARRFSFIVGENESSHTAQSQLVPILQDDAHDPALKQLEAAFNIEKVTKEFFGKYHELFLNVKKALEDIVSKDKKVQDDFTAKGVSIVDFSKKLLGQIVFLYFLQKKGWFGVGRDKDWGTGPKNFLRLLFGKKNVSYRNFFNDVLEPLFYEALAVERTDDFYSRFNCKIPFLNGGLFDPINNYDWVHADILLPNELFSNKKNDSDEGNGILDIFDLYNFTVKEDEPLEKEVAIDPEMLGKVFENLLEVKDRKSKGTYYTPREIVHYMCQESLINYLDTAINTGDVSLVPTRPPQGKLFGQPDPQQGALKTTGYRGIVPREDIEAFVHRGEFAVEHDSRVEALGKETQRYSYKLPENIRHNASLIDERLATIRICDPAVGSGAFLVGMMTEIVRTRNVLTPYLPVEEVRSNYIFKRHAIQNCLYGVDIDPGAVEIAKLRLWLSLVVDEGDIKKIQPLPNLDYKIVCGNSLLGVKRDMFNDELFRKLEELKPLYFNETNARKKQEYKKQIDQLIRQITNNTENFDFEVYFSEVFHDKAKGGFNLVIANPPYGIVFDLELKNILEADYPSFCRNNDIYIAFYEKGVELLASNGTLVFISPNTFLNGDYFRRFRKLLTAKTRINEIIDHKEFLVFDDPTVFVCTLSCTKMPAQTFPYTYVLKEAQDAQGNFSCKRITLNDSSEKPFKPEDTIMRKVLAKPDVDILDNLFFAKDVGFNYWTRGRGKTRGNSIGSKIFYQGTKRNKKDIAFLKGRVIEKYYCGTPSNFLRHDYKEWLDQSVDTFGFSKEFLEIIPKIVYRQTAHRIIATIDTMGFYLDKTVHLIVPKSKGTSVDLRFLLALLNSRLFEHFYAYISQEKEGRTFAQVKTTYIKQLPIIVLPPSDQHTLIRTVDQILAITKDEGYLTNPPKQAKVKDLERQIDQMVYELYGLTPEEIAVVEGFNKK